jgi:esterase/lipase superfamily enzyme
VAYIRNIFWLIFAGLLAGIAGSADAAQSAAAPDPACAAQTDLPGQSAADAHLYFVTTRQVECRDGGRVSFKNGRAGPTHGRFAGERLRPILQSQAAWMEAIQADLANSEGRLLVYVHGYFNSFQDAAERVQVIRRQTGFVGPIVVFSWPSVACVLPPSCYTRDEENALWTQPQFDRILGALLADPATTDIALVAHSMGNRIVLRGIVEADRSVGALSRQKLRTIILASPDVDREMFGRDYLSVLDQPNRSTTIYASQVDQALGVSRRVHGYPRAGETVCTRTDEARERRDFCPIVLREGGGVVLVDTTRVHRGEGHRDFVKSPEAAMDLCRVLAHRTAVGREPIADQVNAWVLTRRATASDPCPR